MRIIVLLLMLASGAGAVAADEMSAEATSEGRDESAALRAALAPHAWMSQQADWPCRYGAQVEQRRELGGRSLRSEGRLYQDCQQGLIWQVDRPVPGAQVYAQNGNYLALDRRGEPRPLDGLAERRIARLLQDLFIGDVSALLRDFTHRLDDEASPAAVRLVPRDAQLAARLDGIVISGDAVSTSIRVQTAGEAPEEMLGLRLFAFESLSEVRCTQWLGGAGDAQRSRAEAACDALARPGRWLERARSGPR